ncbi:MAG: hypothetical protein K1000chlam2_01858 [Chlamydiae bacterium]|nr:hypothetical protein [Chlamydiota bacterium]
MKKQYIPIAFSLVASQSLLGNFQIVLPFMLMLKCFFCGESLDIAKIHN